MNGLKGLHFEIYQDAANKWRWQLWLNDNIIATSHQGHKEFDQAEAEIWYVMDANNQTPILCR